MRTPGTNRVNARQHAWQRWKREYIHALFGNASEKTKDGSVPDVGDILLIVGDEKNSVLRLVKDKDGVSFCVTTVEESSGLYN